MTTFAIVYNTKSDVRINQMQKLIERYDQFIQVADTFWIVDCEGDPVGIKGYLNRSVGTTGSLLVFEVTKEWAFTGSQEVTDWLNGR
ncbi:hypothetical protein [Acinetobacter gerneri]|uniref:hypothetical protein n=1 Tax=Acinetobacter gerneri TaxID=202952 RepID=UPI0028AC495E|nr:hypothetical protein [Acinetobacter gerneri]